MTAKTLASIQRLKIVELDFMFEAAGRKVACENSRPSFFAPGPSGVSRLFSQARRKAEGNISYNYRFHIVTRLKSELQITDIIFSQCLP